MTLLETTRRQVALGYVAALGAALSYGAVTLVARKIVDDYSLAIVGTAFSLLFGTIIVGTLFHRHVLTDSIRVPRRGWVMVALAGCASAWGVSFLFLALTKAPVVLVAPLAGTSPLLSIALTHIFLQRLERVTWRTVLGAVLVLGGVGLIAVGTE